MSHGSPLSKYQADLDKKANNGRIPYYSKRKHYEVYITSISFFTFSCEEEDTDSAENCYAEPSGQIVCLIHQQPIAHI